MAEIILEPIVDDYYHYVLCDIDGTLADCRHRLHHVKTKPKRWDKFFNELGEDTLIRPVAEVIDAFFHRHYRVLLLSGRGEEHREATTKWLDKVGFNSYHELIMRQAKDSRDDTIVKRELFEARFPTAELRNKVLGVFDDRPKVIRMWKEIGVFVFNVGDGVEF